MEWSLVMRRQLGFALLGTALLAGAAMAQVPTPERRTFTVSVVDRHGVSLRGLSADHFRGKFQGKPVKIISVSEDLSPRRIALVLDTSGSMITVGPSERVWSTTQVLVDILGDSSSVAIFTLADELEKHSGFLRDKPQLQQVLSQLRGEGRLGKGRTALFDGILGVLREFDPPRFGDVICLISDAWENGSQAERETAEKELARSGVRLFLLLLHASPLGQPASFREAEIQKQAGRLLRASGGLMMKEDLGFAKPQKLSEDLRIFSEYIARAYRLEVEFPFAVDKARQWELEVVDVNRKRMKNVEVVYPRLLVPHIQPTSLP